MNSLQQGRDHRLHLQMGKWLQERQKLPGTTQQTGERWRLSRWLTLPALFLLLCSGESLVLSSPLAYSSSPCLLASSRITRSHIHSFIQSFNRSYEISA